MATVPTEEEEAGEGQEGSSGAVAWSQERRTEQGYVAHGDKLWQSTSRQGADEASTSKARWREDLSQAVEDDQTSAGQVDEVDGAAVSLSTELPSLTYRLELPQQPTRGRTCGFGDADRRALSAPLIARLRIFEKSQEVVPGDLDTAFLICAADLWSGDGTEDMNLVRHPALHQTKATPISGTSPLPIPSQIPQPGPRLSPSSLDSLLDVPSQVSIAGPSSLKRAYDYDDQLDQGPPQTASSENPPRRNSIRFSDIASYAPIAIPAMSAPQQPEASTFAGINTSPSNHTFAFQAPIYRQSGPLDPLEAAYEPVVARRRSSQTSASIPATSQGLPPRTGSSSSAYPRPWTAYSIRPSTAATSVALMPGVSLGPPGTASGLRPTTAMSSLQNSEYACVKNLVGALTVNGHILRVPGEQTSGLFFVFHDLSVRTEGTFSIRLRLAAIGSLAAGVQTGVMPVLCEAFTRPFEVMSAKKFPGMLDPTPLSQAFAKQGLRIPTRKGANRKKRRPVDSRLPALPQDYDYDMEAISIPEEQEPSP